MFETLDSLVINGRNKTVGKNLNSKREWSNSNTVFTVFKHSILSWLARPLLRYDDPDSAGSSFSMLLGNAPHLDGQYAVFGKVTKGYDTHAKLEELPTRKEGIFVMPLERISILSSYYYADKIGGSTCEDELVVLRRRYAQATNLIDKQRKRFLPG
ncbi:hypothetical protein R1flu_008426 [Riccia fluitans]|uniref:PPIase cyclophilin-type domain-containing protein n=1 Tax=Riccia fluitans TaxID=41844 RepID=A0ABD1YBZ9_9MARC